MTSRLLLNLGLAALAIALVLVVIMPFYAKPGTFVTPETGDVGRIFLEARERLPDYPFKHDARPVSERPTTKNYFYTRYGVPAITYETGDETDRDAITRSAVVFAEEMMRLMLEQPKP